jgi:hypothetical protein
LPVDAFELARIKDVVNDGYEYLFIKNNGGLSIIETRERYLTNGDLFYACYQTDFPFEFLRWFYSALTDFQKSPAEGGLHAGAMTSADQNVGGEMLCIQRTTDGYAVLNRSRCRRDVEQLRRDLGDFDAQEIIFEERFLFESGLINLIKDLAARYDAGLL